MDTRERLLKFQELSKTASSTEVDKFIDDNRDDKRFISLVDLRTAFLSGFKKEIEERLFESQQQDENDPRSVDFERQSAYLDVIRYAAEQATSHGAHGAHGACRSGLT
jgi:hypothetical protein